MDSLPGCGLATSNSYVCQHEHASAAEQTVQDVLRTLRESPESWTYVKEKEGVKISKKEVPGQSMPMVRGDARVKFPAIGLLRLLTSDSVETQLALDPQLKSYEQVEAVDDQTRLVFTEFNGRWPVAERYFSVIQSVRRVEEGVLLAVASMDHPSTENKCSKGAVKGILHYSGWLFKPVGTDSCDISYMANLDLNGKIPGFILNMVVNENPEIVCRLTALASNFEFSSADQLTLETVPATTEDLSELASNVEPEMSRDSVVATPEVSKQAVSKVPTPSRQVSQPSSWRAWSGREDGKDKYKFGDLTRGLARKRKLKRQATMDDDADAAEARTEALLGDRQMLKVPSDPQLLKVATRPSMASTTATATSSLSQGEISPETLDSLFSKAQDAVKTLKPKPSNDDLLQMYAHFKQATLGPNGGTRPSAFNVKDCYKYDAWKGLGNMSSDACKEAYCALADRLKPGWREAANQTSAETDLRAEVEKEVSLVPVERSKPDINLQNRVVLVTIASAFGLKFVTKLTKRSKGFLVILLLLVLNPVLRSRMTPQRGMLLKLKGPVDWQGIPY